MQQDQQPSDLRIRGRVTVCFETEDQARALAAMVSALGPRLSTEIQLLYLLPGGHSPAAVLAPWLDEVSSAIRHATGADVRIRGASRSIEDLRTEFELEANGLGYLASDPGNAGASLLASRLLVESPVETILLHGHWPEHAEDILLSVDPGPTSVAAAGIASRSAAALDATIVAIASASPRDKPLGAWRHLDQALSVARSVFDVRAYERVVQGRSRETALITACRDQQPDLLVAGLPRGGLVGEFASARIPRRLMNRAEVPMVLVNVPVRPALQRVTAAASRLFRVLPTLSTGQRAAIYSQVRRAARGDVDFLFMIIASTALAALGLRLDSAVVIIGAMLVAPLMSPIVGVGLAVAQGDARLLALSARSVARGSLFAIGASFTLGLLLPGGEVTGEMLKRANPSLLDLAVAIASGCAGAYALSRKGVSSSLPGVAIAVSLVPPLATVGVALSMREGAIASGSLLLFVVNLAAVAAASGVMFVWMGFSPEVDQIGRRRTFGKGVAGLGAMLVAVTLPLAWSAVDHDPSSGQVEVASIVGAGADALGASVVEVSASTVDGELVASAVLRSERQLGREELDRIRLALEDATGLPVVLTARVELTTTVGTAGAGVSDP